MSSFGNSNRRMTDAFVDPFPNEGALCHSVAAQCCVCMEGIQQWSHSLCHLMSRKSPPPSLPVCNKSCKDTPAGSLLRVAKPSLWCPFRAFLDCPHWRTFRRTKVFGENKQDEKWRCFCVEAGGGCLIPLCPCHLWAASIGITAVAPPVLSFSGCGYLQLPALPQAVLCAYMPVSVLAPDFCLGSHVQLLCEKQSCAPE